jgi:hypothetical protein
MPALDPIPHHIHSHGHGREVQNPSLRPGTDVPRRAAPARPTPPEATGDPPRPNPTRAHAVRDADGTAVLASAWRVIEATGGALRPTHAAVPRRVTDLVPGDVVLEPVLGEVRVAHVTRFPRPGRRRHVQVHWVADDARNTAARVLPAHSAVSLRVPAWRDVYTINRGIDRAVRHQREIDPQTARLIAAHLYRGPGSALYIFAMTCTVTDGLYDELDEAVPAHSPLLRRWVNALANQCLNRTDHRRGVQPEPPRPARRRYGH